MSANGEWAVNFASIAPLSLAWALRQ